jgi:multidrug efflux pump subunit AcrA (membrane-fusion protein)
MFVNVDLVMRRVANTMIVPRSAVLFRDDLPVVFVVEANSDPIARMVQVEIGITQGDQVEIVSGLSGDEQVVVEGNAFLEDEQLVRPVNGK